MGKKKALLLLGGISLLLWLGTHAYGLSIHNTGPFTQTSTQSFWTSFARFTDPVNDPGPHTYEANNVDFLTGSFQYTWTLKTVTANGFFWGLEGDNFADVNGTGNIDFRMVKTGFASSSISIAIGSFEHLTFQYDLLPEPANNRYRSIMKVIAILGGSPTTHQVGTLYIQFTELPYNTFNFEMCAEYTDPASAGTVSGSDIEVTDSSPIPEPTTLALLAVGGVGLLGYGWRRKRRQGREKA